jgi:CMP-N-acetylneuraminic acid synthetase
MTISVFLPCRKGSQRVPKKNIKPFAGYKHGLIEIKLEQLINANLVDQIVLSTNDEEILEYADNLRCSKIVLHHRIDKLASNECSTDNLVSHAVSLIPKGDILWTHVTSPFLSSESYNQIINQYFLVLKEGYDSLMTTNIVKSFLWDEHGPINYAYSKEKWPRTQTLKPIHEVNSAVFLASAKIYLSNNDRIGSRPFLYALNKIEGFDIDWEEDFKIAEAMVDYGVASV